MRSKLITTIIIGFIATLILSYCFNFSNRFHRKINKSKEIALESNQAVKFDLSELTYFDWDSVLFIEGNESVPILAKEIEQKLGRKAKELKVGRDRFYFISDNKIIVKEVGHGFWVNRKKYYIELCQIESGKFEVWLLKKECVFDAIPRINNKNSDVILFPDCLTRFNRNDYGILSKK